MDTGSQSSSLFFSSACPFWRRPQPAAANRPTDRPASSKPVLPTSDCSVCGIVGRFIGQPQGFLDLHQFLPPRPPRLHYSVFTSAPSTVTGFVTDGLDYLVALLNASDVPVDELLAANLRYTSGCYRDGGEFLNLAGRELAQLLRADYARLTAILRRCLAPHEVG